MSFSRKIDVFGLDLFLVKQDRVLIIYSLLSFLDGSSPKYNFGFTLVTKIFVKCPVKVPIYIHDCIQNTQRGTQTKSGNLHHFT